ncbi:uncharacterized protein [Henckelia pumila]|uniref:uncharacterized protein n=1 Tax=Henckelia pumila TaxID=405737 RepID=UPI003C6E606D
MPPLSKLATIHDMDSSLDFKLRIIKARNIDPKSSGDLFVRCYLPAGNKQRVIKLDTHLISPKSNLIWDQTYSLNCPRFLQQQDSIIFELRNRIPAPFLSCSKLLGRAEVTWKECLESRNMKMEKWISMIPKSGRVHEDSKPAAVHIAVKIQESVIDIGAGLIKWDGGCICMDGIGCNSCFLDYDFFALGSSLEAIM